MMTNIPERLNTNLNERLNDGLPLPSVPDPVYVPLQSGAALTIAIVDTPLLRTVSSGVDPDALGDLLVVSAYLAADDSLLGSVHLEFESEAGLTGFEFGVICAITDTNSIIALALKTTLNDPALEAILHADIDEDDNIVIVTASESYYLTITCSDLTGARIRLGA
jgi:hypothetical protein